jgi:hypothetical protein
VNPDELAVASPDTDNRPRALIVVIGDFRASSATRLDMEISLSSCMERDLGIDSLARQNLSYGSNGHSG